MSNSTLISSTRSQSIKKSNNVFSLLPYASTSEIDFGGEKSATAFGWYCGLFD